MNNQLKELLLPFYFGSLNETERVFVERELLSDVEVLVRYLDLKREVESAALLESQPSQKLWAKLRFGKPTSKKALFSLSLGVAAAAALAFILMSDFLVKGQDLAQPDVQGILFDNSSEHSVSSTVL